MIDYMSRILSNDLSKYVDWDKWLPAPKCNFMYKGIPGEFVRVNGEKEPCIVVEEKEVFGNKYCRIILYKNGIKPYLIDTERDNIEWLST